MSEAFEKLIELGNDNKYYDKKIAYASDRHKEVPKNNVRAKASEKSSERQKVRRKKRAFVSIGMGIDLPFLVIVLILLVVGIIMMFSASYANAYYQLGNPYYYLGRQIGFAIVGIAGMMGISYVDYHIWHKLAPIALMASYITLIIVLILPSKNGVHRWLGIGSFGIQASEITKFAIILFFAHFGSKYHNKMHTIKYGVLPGLCVFVSTAVLLLLEPHYSCIVIVALLTLMMMFISGVELKWFGFAGGAIAIAFLVGKATGLLSYAMERMDGWGQALIYTTPEMWQTTWQTRNSLYAIGSGGLFGLGLGQSRQKYLYLPEPQNDFVFSVVCEEIGFIGAIIILLLFAFLVWRGITIAIRSKDRFGKLLGIGLSGQIGFQVILNIFVITDLLPNTGISLPFFSYGGSSLVMILLQMGIILSISRQSNIEKR